MNEKKGKRSPKFSLPKVSRSLLFNVAVLRDCFKKNGSETTSDKSGSVLNGQFILCQWKKAEINKSQVSK